MTPSPDTAVLGLPLAQGAALGEPGLVRGAAPLAPIDVSAIIETQRLNGFVIRLVVISWLVTFLDGFDLNAIAFVAPYLKTAYRFDNPTLAVILASGGAGALLGGVLFGFLGDKVGRRRAIIASVGFFGLFTLFLALADRYWELVFMRFVGGIALGGALPLIWALSIEYVPVRYRATVVTLIMLGYGLGVSVAGPVSVALIPRFGWQSVFICGGGVSLAAALVVFLKLPESLRFLAHRGDDPERMLRIVQRLIPNRRIEASQLVLTSSPATPRSRGPAVLFDGYLRWLTPLLWLVFAASSMTMYFFTAWGPIVMEQMGLSRTGAALSISANSIASAIGGIAVMRFTDRLGAASLAVMPAIAVPLLIVTGLMHLSVGLVMALTTAMYLLLGGNHYGVQSILGLYYPTAERARGAGWASSIGKVGGVAATLLGGWLLSSHLISRSPFLVLAVFPIVVCLGVLGIAAIARRGNLRDA
jgi:AAHS family 4-hydroxybenzoate transporter-like MFS transporter